MTGEYGNGYITHSKRVDCEYLSTRLRSQDAAEIPHGITTFEALDYGRVNGISLTVFYKDLPVMIFGGVPCDGYSDIWMVGTPDIFKIRRELLTYGKKFAMTVIGDKPYGSNAVWVGNKQSLRWLKFIGAEFSDAIIKDDKEFLPFKLYK